MRVHPVDLATAAVVVAVTVVPVAMTSVWMAVALAVLASAPVVWVRWEPLTVGLVVGIATTVLAAVYTPPFLPAGPLVAIYVIASESPAFWRRVCVLVTIAGVTISLVVPDDGDLATYRYLAVAYLAAYALGTNLRARRAQAAAAEARERARISREMHDIITHAVGMMVVQADGGAMVVHDDPDRAAKAFDAIAETGRGAVAQLRAVMQAVRSPGADQVHHLVNQTPGAVLQVAGEPRVLSAEVDSTVYRMVQEALTNAVRHAGASTIRVRLHWQGRTLTVDVVDDGRGPVAGPGFGLRGMRERVTGCGGTLRTGPGPAGTGFAVHATLPVG